MSTDSGFSICNKLLDIQPVTHHNIAATTDSPAADRYTVAAKGVHTLEKIQRAFAEVELSGGRRFDIEVFAELCVSDFRNFCVLSSEQDVTSLRQAYSNANGIYVARLSDHRDLMQSLWVKAVFNRRQFINASYQQFITQQQAATLFSTYQATIHDIFSRYVLQFQKNLVVQPHPTRALLSSYSQLNQEESFDLSLYHFGQQTLNFLLISQFVAKNFLQFDKYHDNDQGAICLAGSAGSGKTTIATMLQQFFNGFLIQDNGKGFAEFQNRDIIVKSMIRCEELPIPRMLTSDWKLAADLLETVKVRIKNNPDIEVKKFVPVVATTNSDPYDALYAQYTQSLQKEEERGNYSASNIAAVRRRWVFVRYTESWLDAHPEVKTQGKLLRDIYTSERLYTQLMVSMIALSVTHTQYILVDMPQLMVLYGACIRQFAMTIFGQVYMKNWSVFMEFTDKANHVYSTQNTFACKQLQHATSDSYIVLLKQHLRELILQSPEGAHSQLLSIYNDHSIPIYVSCALLVQDHHIISALEQGWRCIARTFIREQISVSMNSDFYHKLMQYMDLDIECQEQQQNEPESSNISEDDLLISNVINDCADIQNYRLDPRPTSPLIGIDFLNIGSSQRANSMDYPMSPKDSLGVKF